jgi:hypothetical protein
MNMLSYLCHVKYVKLSQRSKLQTQRKRRKGAPSDEPMVASVQASVHCTASKMKMTLSDDPTIQFLDALDEL